MLKLKIHISIKSYLGIVLLIVFSALFYNTVLAKETATEVINVYLKQRIETELIKNRFSCRSELICGVSLIPVFYQQRDFAPAWYRNGKILPQTAALISEIKNAYDEGLRPDGYHLATILSLIQTIENKKTLKEPIDPAMWVDLELLLTDAFMLYSSHLLAGRVNPETIHTDWIIVNPTADLIGILQSALRSNQIRQALNDFRPLHLGYIGLKNSLADYRKRAEKNVWSPLLPGKSIKKGKSGLLVRQLCERLTLLGDLKTSKQIPIDLFDESVEAAVRRFQKRHGLRSDGIVGPRTLAILNIPIRKRVRQIEINMERWRWIPRNLGNRYILVNVAEFNMWVTENRQRSLNMRVVVGRPFRRTPVFSSKMTYMVINPFWNIPTSIAVKDILPKIQEENQYLDQQGIKVFENWKKDALELNPQTIDWKQIGPRNFFYRLRQDPGPQNALGRIKFMFPNKFAVYLHDTPKRFLFKETVRDFSSGCIRIEKPIDLAVYITRNDPRWTKEELLKAIAAGQRKVITLREPIAIHLQYWTAWVDDKGELHFRDDIYDRDNALDSALKERLPRM